jgi:hypothetical protein
MIGKEKVLMKKSNLLLTLAITVCAFSIVFQGCKNLSAVIPGAKSVELYVSPDGDDTAAGTIDAPFATITRARDKIRNLKTDGLKSDVTVYLRGGTYYIDETIVLGLKDSAPKGKTITYASYPGEEAIISSGKKITGWKKLAKAPRSLPKEARGKVWVADMPETKGGKWRFKTLYNGPDMLPRSSSDGFIPTKSCPTPALKYRWVDRNTLEFPKGEVKNWPNLEDIEILIRPTAQWLVNYLPLQSVDEKKLIAKTSILGTYWLGALGGKTHKGNPCCWVENVIDFIDTPGEWALNTKQGKLYLWPKSGKPGDIYAPTLRELVKVQGKNVYAVDGDIPVTGIVFKGLTFTQGDRDVWEKDTAGIQHDWEMWDKDNAALRFRGAADCKVVNCTFRDSGGTGVRSDRYGQNIKIISNTFRNLGGTGILLCGYGPGLKDVNKNNQIVNNDISRCGQLFWHSPAIFIWQSGENIARNNRIHDIPYDAVVISGVRPRYFGIFDPVKWLDEYENFKGLKDLRENMLTIRWDEVGHPKTAAESRRFAHARNNIIKDNEFHNVMQVLGDGNAIYYSCAGEGNRIERNLIYNSRRAVTEIRFDDDQEESYVLQNIVFGNGIKIKHTNYLENNFIIGGQIHIRPETNVGATILRNVIYATSEKDSFYNLKQDLLDLGRPDYNLLYCKDAKKGKALLAEAREMGHEKHGIFANPMFEDLAGGNLKFKKTSPAHKLGIEDIDTEKIGLLDDPAFPRLRKQGFRQAIDSQGDLDF